MASGSDQLSYCAASTRNTSTTASAKTYMAVLPACDLQVRQLGPLGPHRRGSVLSAPSSIRRSIAWPELVPSAASPLIAADGYML